MPVKFECPKCQSRLTVASRYAGRRGRCPKCRAKIDVPGFEFSAPDSDGVYEIPPPNDTDQTPTLTQPPLAPGPTESIRPEAPPKTQDLRGLVALPRWVIYVQGAMLGIVATSFFVFGLMIGLNTQTPQTETIKKFRSNVSGSVYYDDGIYRRPDFEAVVIWLPVDAKPNPRPDGATLMPNSFLPLDNPSMEIVRNLGGAVVRVDDDATYQVQLDGNRDYWVLVVSKNKAAEIGRDIPKNVRAELGAYFFPIEDVIGDRDFDWSRANLRSLNEKRPEVVFQ